MFTRYGAIRKGVNRRDPRPRHADNHFAPKAPTKARLQKNREYMLDCYKRKAGLKKMMKSLAAQQGGKKKLKQWRKSRARTAIRPC